MALVVFDKNNKSHIECIKKLNNDIDIKKRFSGFLPNLLRNEVGLLNRGFLVSYDNELIGYVDISSYSAVDEAVYLREAVFSEYRGKGYGKKMLNDVSKLIFDTYPQIKRIRLKIDDDNLQSLNTANSVNFIWDGSDYYSLENPNYINENKIR